MTTPAEQPPIQAIKQLNLPPYETFMLSNGMPVYILNGGSEPVMRIEVVFKAGATTEIKPGVAEFMAGLLSEGTQKMSSVELAEHIESRGATVQTRGGVDTVRIRLFTLTRFLPELLEAIIDVIEIPAFDPGELKVYAENKVERLQIELKKNEVLAYRHLTEVIFGKSHPYGKNLKKKDYLSITSEDLRYHHVHNVLPDRGMVFISGSLGGKEIESIQQTLGQWKPISPNGLSLPKMPEPRKKAVYREITAPQSHQASIRIGRKLFSQRHPDFNGLILLNTILGGYFGSRLMAEIRENKGLTYGIYSSIDSFAEDGCIYISTETATDNVEAVITAIKGEVQRLRTEPVSEAELDMARNYLMGHIMTQLDGPFASMDFIKSMKIERLDDSHFQQMIMTLQSLTAEDIRQLAEQYLNLEEWSTIVVK